MKKNIRFIGIVFAIAMLAACSNSDSGKSNKKTGTTVFFHNVKHAATLSLESESNDRGLGEVDFEQFGPGISLPSKTWDVSVNDLRDELDGSDDVQLVDSALFKVTSRRRTVHAIIGDSELDNVELVSIPLAYDEEMDDDRDDNLDGIADKKSLYINFANIHPDYSQLDVYLVTLDKCSTDLDIVRNDPDDNQPVAVVDFKQTSVDIRMPENITKYCLRVAEAGSDTEIYNSGERAMKDYAQQTIIIAPYSGTIETNSPVTAFYYYGVDNKAEKWPHTDSFGQIRIYNALELSTNLDYTYDNGVTPVIGPVSLADGDLSSFSDVSTKFVSYSVLLDEMAYPGVFAGVIEPIVNVQQGESWSVILFGDLALPGMISSVVVPETDTVYTNKASLTLTNAGYIAEEDDRKPYNVHITIPGEAVDSSSVDIPSLGYADYGVTTINAGNTYKVSVTDVATSTNNKAFTFVKIEGGENIHMVFRKKPAGGFELVRLIGDPSPARSEIEFSDTTPTAGDNVTVTLVVKDDGGNKLSDKPSYTGGDTVELFADANPLVVTDNADGTYSATVTSAVADTLAITAKINSVNVASSAQLTFAP